MVGDLSGRQYVLLFNGLLKGITTPVHQVPFRHHVNVVRVGRQVSMCIFPQQLLHFRFRPHERD